MSNGGSAGRLAPGEAGPITKVGELTLVDFVRYAGASGDFNPIHFDREFAATAGAPSPFAQGMLSAGILAHYIADWVGRENVRRLRFRFLDRLWPKQALECAGVVSAVREDGNQVVVNIEAWLRTETGVQKVRAMGEVRFNREVM